MPSKIAQLHFRKYSQRGPLSSVLMDDGSGDEDLLTIFWTELGEDPADEQEAASLLVSQRIALIRKAQDTGDMTVEKGVLRDPTFRADWQRGVVNSLKNKVGWS